MQNQAVVASATVVAVAILSGAILLRHMGQPRVQSPRDCLPPPSVHIDHAQLISGPLPDGPSATRACLSCHPASAHEVIQTSHWTWVGLEVNLPESGQPAHIGKKNLINNFCLHAGANIESCSSCHVGYGWKDDSFDFHNPENVDCLVCHEQTGSYRKVAAGLPRHDVDLLKAAQSVGRPTRRNCGQCHFYGCGGHAVKQGDLDASMNFPTERIDVHMGKFDMQCVDCHRTQGHEIPGLAMSIALDRSQRVRCSGCHGESPHNHQRLDGHVKAVACETCHIPRMAIDYPTNVYWDWSKAGKDLPEDPLLYLKKRGAFVYAQDVRPEYFWYNGRARRYLTGEKIDPVGVVRINRPLGELKDLEAKIFPFKVHRGKQVYDKVHRHLLAPKTYGPNGFDADFDWDKACRLGAKSAGLAYSGQYDFVETEMYLPLSHMVQAKQKALQCTECHGEGRIMDWKALGYDGDPAFQGTQGSGRRDLANIRNGAGSDATWNESTLSTNH